MNYLQEIKFFNDWLVINPSVSSDDIVLWYALMNLNNITGWQNEFTVAISTIIDRTRLSRSAIYRSRNKLVQLGRITVKERPGNQCSVYQVISFVSPNETQTGTQRSTVSPNRTHSGTQTGTQVGTQTGTQPGTINKTKLNKTKLNKDIPGEAPGGEKKAQGITPEKEKVSKEGVTPHWQVLVDTWFSFYKKVFSIEPSFKGMEAKNLKSIVVRLEKHAKTGGFEWSEQKALETFTHFLEHARNHSDWLARNFLLGNMASQFDAIINPLNNGHSKTSRQPAGAKINGSKLDTLFDERYGKGGRQS